MALQLARREVFQQLVDRGVHHLGQRQRVQAMPSTASASSASTRNSRAPMSFNAATWVVGHGAENHALVHPQGVGRAENKRGRSEKTDQKLYLIAPTMTMNSPTKPLVAGSPQLAMANSIMNDANLGMVLTTPP